MKLRYAWLALAGPLSCSGVIGIEALPRPVSDDGGASMGDVDGGEDADVGKATFCSKMQLEGPQHKYCADFDESITTLWVGGTKKPLGFDYKTVSGGAVYLQPVDGGAEAVVFTSVDAGGPDKHGGFFELTLDKTIAATVDVASDLTVKAEPNAFVVVFTLVFPRTSLNTGGSSAEEHIKVWLDEGSIGMSIHHNGEATPSEPVRFLASRGKRVRLKREGNRFRLYLDDEEIGSKIFTAISTVPAVIRVWVR